MPGDGTRRAPEDDAADRPPPGTRAEELHEALRAAGLRVTRQRAAIVQVLEEADDHPDANEVHARAREIEPSVSLATVYRTLSVLTGKGVVSRVAIEGAPARFETADAPHHDHIVDVETGEVIEFVSAEIEAAQRRIAREHGYEVLWHRLELHCRKRGGGPA